MRTYKATTTCHVLRYENPETKALVKESESGEDWKEIEVAVTVTGKGHNDPGRTYGPPEDCWEPSSDCEVTEFSFSDERLTEKCLTEDEIKAMEDDVAETAKDNEEWQAEEAADRDRDRNYYNE